MADLPANKHQWQFVPTGDAIAAVCPTCGLLRVSSLPGQTTERHMDLRGACPGEPQAPDASPRAKYATI